MLAALVVIPVFLLLSGVLYIRNMKYRRAKAAARARYYAAECPTCLGKIPAGAIVCMHCLAPIKSVPVEADTVIDRPAHLDGTPRPVARPIGVVAPRTPEGARDGASTRLASRFQAGHGRTGA